MSFGAENEEENKLFIACVDTYCKPSDLSFIDTRCSNHMIGIKSFFKKLDETQKIKVCILETKERCKLRAKA